MAASSPSPALHTPTHQRQRVRVGRRRRRFHKVKKWLIVAIIQVLAVLVTFWLWEYIVR